MAEEKLVQKESDCGRDFEHDPHYYATKAGTKVCDGEINKDVTGRITT